MTTPVNIRQQEKEWIKASLLPHRIVQICGPPMVGKSTLLTQAVREKADDIASRRIPGHNIIHHDFGCENAGSFQAVLHQMAHKLPIPAAVDTDQVIATMRAVLENCRNYHHILIFHKCQNLRANAHDHEFLDFLLRLLDHFSDFPKLSVVFTTYKMFHMSDPRCILLEIDVLTDPWDVISLLQTYAPRAQATRYAHICLNVLPLPSAVRRFAEEFLAHDVYRDHPKVLENIVNKDMGFLSLVFKNKMAAVETWIPEHMIAAVLRFSHFMEDSFTEAHFCYVSTDETVLNWKQFIKFLRENHVLRTSPVPCRFMLHPLLVYYCMISWHQRKLALNVHWQSIHRNRFTQFLCRVLDVTETNISLHGRRGQVYGCLAQDWPCVKKTISTALHCNENTYRAVFKAIVAARGVIMRNFLHESHDLYSELLDTARMCGTRSEWAVLQALLGHTMAASSRLAKGTTWQDAENELDSAIQTLRTHGPAFVCMWALDRKAIILTRQSKYVEALRCFNEAKRLTVTEVDDGTLEEMCGVSPLQVKEEKITQAIYEANCLISIKKTQLARDQLCRAHQSITDEFPDHPEHPTLLNSLGLVEDSAGKRDQAVIWYKESLAERRHLHRIIPEILVIPLNNIGQIYMAKGKLGESKKYFVEALNIRLQNRKEHMQTALTLGLLGQFYTKRGNFAEAFKSTLEADKILSQIAQNHDSRLKLNNILAHQRQLLNLGHLRGEHVSSNELSETIRSDKESGAGWMPNLSTLEGIDNADLERSAHDYFMTTIQIAEKIKKNFVDESHDCLLLAHEHSMLYHLEDSREKFDHHMQAILPYFQVSQGKAGETAPDPSKQYLGKHAGLLSYISETQYAELDKSMFLQHLTRACINCRTARSFNIITVDEMWFGGRQQVDRHTRQREIAGRQQQRRSDTQKSDPGDTQVKTPGGDQYAQQVQNTEELSQSSSQDTNGSCPLTLIGGTRIIRSQQEKWDKIQQMVNPGAINAENATAQPVAIGAAPRYYGYDEPANHGGPDLPAPVSSAENPRGPPLVQQETHRPRDPDDMDSSSFGSNSVHALHSRPQFTDSDLEYEVRNPAVHVDPECPREISGADDDSSLDQSRPRKEADTFYTQRVLQQIGQLVTVHTSEDSSQQGNETINLEDSHSESENAGGKGNPASETMLPGNSETDATRLQQSQNPPLLSEGPAEKANGPEASMVGNSETYAARFHQSQDSQHLNEGPAEQATGPEICSEVTSSETDDPQSPERSSHKT